MKRSLKALTLIALGIFLYTRLANGTLLYYINQRFAWLTLLAVIGLLLVAVSYRQRPAHIHPHLASGHEHAFSWAGLFLIALPVMLGLLVPPRPLGASAMESREISLGSLSSSATPRSISPLVMKGEKDILDWLIAFQKTPDPATFSDQEARVIGFVYRDERFDAETFMISRFAVSCCVADATAVGLIVRWPEAASLARDQWVEVSGYFQPGEFYGQQVPLLVADAVTPVETPNQPYLYYY